MINKIVLKTMKLNRNIEGSCRRRRANGLLYCVDSQKAFHLKISIKHSSALWINRNKNRKLCKTHAMY